MVPGYRIRKPHLLIVWALVLLSCATGPGTTSGAAPTTTSSPPSTTTIPTATTATVANAATSSLPEELDAEIGIPQGEGPFPAVVLVHGGGWIGGGPLQTRSLASYLTAEGFLTINASYQLSGQVPGFPRAVDDLACAVRYAASHSDSDGTVTILGHSAGAHLAALVALTGDDYGAECPIPGDGLPDRLVGLAGPYDISRLGGILLPFFGAGPSDLPQAWEAGNPQRLSDRNPDLVSLIMYGENDGIVEDGFAIDFHEALLEAGADSVLELVEGAQHMDMIRPEFVGDLIVVWLER